MTARLVRGTATLNLDSGRFAIGEGCRPPSVMREFNLASGSAANTLGGAEVVSSKAVNRDWSFSVRDLGSSVADVESGARAISSFLMGAGEPSTPTYFEYKSDTLPIPLWGQFGAPLRFEVVSGYAELGQQYESALYLRPRGIEVVVTLSIKPVAIGQQQRLASAMGGVLEDTWGAADGVNRGTILSISVTNKMTNPVFGASTWNTNWSAGAGMQVVQNTNPEYMLPGQTSSAKITQSGANYVMYQTINAGNTNKHSLSAIIAKQDLSEVTSADCQIGYNGAQTTTYLHIGKGRYLLRAENITGINAGTATGIILGAGKTVYLLAFQMEERTYATPIGWGDLLGWAWTSTAHATTSTRTSGYLRLPIGADTLLPEQGSIRVIWAPWYPYTVPATIRFFDTRDGGHTTSLSAYWNNSDQKLYLTDGTNTCASPALTFAAGDIWHLVFSWGPGGLNIERNGVNVATNATFTYPAPGTYLYIGSNYTPTEQANCPLRGFATYSTPLTTAQALADYTNMLPLLTAGQRAETIPWHWIVDGDDTYDNCTDSTHANWGVVGGVPGSIDAITEINGVSSGTTANKDSCIISNAISEYFVNPAGNLFFNETGTADAANCNGDYLATTVNTGTDYITAAHSITKAAYHLLLDRDFYMLLRLKDLGANLMISGEFTLKYNWATPVLYPSTYSIAITKPTRITNFHSSILAAPNLQASTRVTAKRSVSGSAAVDVDYTILMPRPVLVINHGLDNAWVYNSERFDVTNYSSSTNLLDYSRSISGDTLRFIPNRYNILQVVVGDIGDITDPLTYSIALKLAVTPRWSLV
jgi:hypothetical protein